MAAKFRGVNKTSIDTFNTGSTLNTTHWTNRTGADVTVNASSNGRLLIEDQAAYPGVLGKDQFDLTNKIIAMKWRTPTGATTGNLSQVDLELDDGTPDVGIGLNMFVSPSNSGGKTSQFYVGGGSSATLSDTSLYTSGMGTDLADNTWVGLGFFGPEKILRCFTSTDDGATWTLFKRSIVGGTFNPTICMVAIECGHDEPPATNKGWFLNIDEVAVFSLRTAKVRVGGAWVDAVPKVRVGGTWQTAIPRRRVGGSWV